MELDELMGAGFAKSLIKTFNKKGVKATLFVIFTTGGIDFVGGYMFYHFLEDKVFSHPDRFFPKLRRVSEHDCKFYPSEGEEVHERLFVKKELKTPAYWKEII